MTLYPTTKCTPERAADILEMVGTERIMANSAGDWGKSEPAGGAGADPGDEAPRPPEGGDSQGRLREPAGVLAAMQAVFLAKYNGPRMNTDR